MNDSPIFIHSLFRSGSTFLFKVFRRSLAGYWCYQEPLHEFALFCRENPSGLQDEGEEKVQLLRHPALDHSYFKELAEAWPIWKEVINDFIIYDAYFSDGDEDIGIDYWKALARAARGRPVFQECRTSGRIGAIKKKIDGKHIYLWRNPWDQWWSYKVAPYFDAANQLIAHARHAPLSLRRMLAELNLPCYEHSDLPGSFVFYNKQPVTSEQSYLIFYHLWCLALREGSVHADLMLNIDRLSDSVDYQFEILARLEDAGIDGIDFSDCQVPQGRYLERDKKFFDPLEDRVHQWLKADGWTQKELDKTQALRLHYQPASWTASPAHLAPADLTEQACRARELAIRFETNLAQHARTAAMQLNQLESRVHVAEAQAQQAEAGMQQEQAKAQQIEQREAEARAQLKLALEVSRGAQRMAQQAEARVETHQLHANALEIQLQQLQSKIDELGASKHHWWQQTQQAQIRIDELGGNSHHWWQQACALETERNALRQSASWRITAPLRFASGLVTHPLRTLRSGANVAIHRAICITERPLSHMMAVVLRRPQLSHRISHWLLRYPALYQQLIGVARRGGMITDASRYTATGYSINGKKKFPNGENRKIETSKYYYLESTDPSESKQIDAETALKAIRLELKIFRGEA